MLKYRLSAERDAQFKTKSVADFIRRMEEDKKFNGGLVSIKSLIGNPMFLIDRISKNERVCDPYIQLVTNVSDEYTGCLLYTSSRKSRIGNFLLNDTFQLL